MSDKKRLVAELNGEYGPVWQRMAKQDLEMMKVQLEAGNFTFNEKGVAYNSIGRVVTDDVADKLSLLTNKINVEATRLARREAVQKDFEKFRADIRNPSDEEMAEMRAAFGEGQTVVNVITGQRIQL